VCLKIGAGHCYTVSVFTTDPGRVVSYWSSILRTDQVIVFIACIKFLCQFASDLQFDLIRLHLFFCQMTSPAMRNFVQNAGCVEGDSQHQTYRGHDRIRRRAPESDAPSAPGSADDPGAATTGEGDRDPETSILWIQLWQDSPIEARLNWCDP
jgi:hypothetical protein